MELLTAALVFVAIVGLSVGLWWQGARRRVLRARLRPPDKADAASSGILRTSFDSGEGWPASLATFSVPEALETLIQQSGLAIRPRTVFATMAALGVIATLLGGVR